MKDDLTFMALRVANATRCTFAFHPIDEWSPTDWATAAAGELGEALNKIKKSRRTNFEHLDQERAAIGYELADAVIYIDLLATRLGLDLGDAIRAKFNIVSRRVASPVRL